MLTKQLPTMRKLLKILLISVAGLFIILLLLPFIFQEAIGRKILDAVNETINGEFSIEQADLSLLRDFPSASLGLIHPVCKSYVGNDTTQLMDAQRIYLSINLWDILLKKDVLTIHQLEIEQPTLSLIAWDSLSANYSIAKDTSGEANNSESLDFKIEEYSISDGHVHYTNLKDNEILHINGLSHRGSFNRTGNLQRTVSETAVDSFSFYQQGIYLLKDVKLDWNLSLDINSTESQYKIVASLLKLNDFSLECEGAIHKSNDVWKIDQFKLSSPSSKFKDIFSLIPNAFTKDFKQVISDGLLSFNGELVGAVNPEKNIYPNWKFALQIDHGSLNYPGKPIKLEDVNIKLRSENSNPQRLGAFLSIEEFKFKMQEDYASATLQMNDLFQNVKVDGQVECKLSFEKWSQFFPFDNGTQMRGKLNLKSKFKFNEEDILNNDYSSIQFDGFTQITDFFLKSQDMLDVHIPKAEMVYSPNDWKLKDAIVHYGNSDFQFNGNLKKPLALLNDQTRTELKISHLSNKIDLNELMQTPETNVTVTPSSITQAPSMLNQLNISFNSNIKKILYDVYECSDGKAMGSLMGNALKVQNAEITVNENHFSGSIQFENMLDYLYTQEALKGTINVGTTMLNLDKLMVTNYKPIEGTASSTVYFSLPENMNLDISLNADQFLFSPLRLANLRGVAHLENQGMEIQNTYADVAGGKMALTGLFEAKTNQQPSYNFKYEIKRLEFRNAFKSFFTISKLAPVFEYIDGVFNSTIIFEGKLKQDNFPDFNSLNVDGVIETLEGAIKGFKPLQEISNRIHIKELEGLKLKNTKNWVRVENGTVVLSEFNTNLKDVQLSIGGSHQIEGPMNYNIVADIPSKFTQQYMKEIKLDKGIEIYNDVMSKLGMNKPIGTELSLDVNLTGTITKPNIHITLRPKQGASSTSVSNMVVQTVKDSLKTAGQNALERGKTVIHETSQKAIDSLKHIADRKVDEIGQKAQDEIKKKADSLLNKTIDSSMKKAIDSVGRKILPNGAESVDSIKSKIKEWNPFKKKK